MLGEMKVTDFKTARAARLAAELFEELTSRPDGKGVM